MLKSVLIANRGEIACRIIRTARKLGIKTVAVYSDADSNALHVQLADSAVHIGPSPAVESYLVAEKIIKAAKDAGVDAIHPGYGFLSENADFADAVIKAALIWVGPPPSAIRDMGLKDAAKSLMIKAGVPTTPGYLGEDQSLKILKAEAGKIGYPVLIKAVAGGGGKGMRRVEQANDFKDALESCKREATSAFGDDRVLLEKWITDPRHIEVQIFGDSYGGVIHLFERDCTLQRRHQKVIEEAPAPGMDGTTRQAVCEAAVRAAEAVNYVGAGTVEFIADGSGPLNANKIWFMEMNTRLQVEHPVTEMITGVDLVEWQLRVASGERLPKSQDELSINGWAMEARLYAENPSTGFLPSIGTLDVLDLPDTVRVDTGVTQGSDVSPYYDPMISKLIAHGKTRDEARANLAKACGDIATYPVENNAGFLARLLTEPDFISASVTTGYIGDNLETLTAKPAASNSGLSETAWKLYSRGGASRPSRINDPWTHLTGFRLSADADLSTQIQIGNEVRDVVLAPRNSERFSIHSFGRNALLIEDGWAYLIESPRHIGDNKTVTGSGTITSPMPGRVVSINLDKGQEVSEGQTLVTLEAMKMEHDLTAPFDGVIAEIKIDSGAQLGDGDVILKMNPIEDEE